MLLPLGLALTALVAAPGSMTPGDVGLLVLKAERPEVVAVWRSALADPSPSVRAAAARAANVSGTRDLLSALTRALESEADPEAGAEEILAIAALADPSTDELLDAAARRLGDRAAARYVELLCRTRGVALVEQFATLPTGLWTRSSAIALVTRGEPAPLNRAAILALRVGDHEAWQAILGLARERGLALDRGLIASALGHASAEVRTATAWHALDLRLSDRRSAVAEPLASALAALATRADAGPELAFALELLGRVGGAPRTESTASLGWLEARPDLLSGDVLGREELYRYFSTTEAAAISTRLTGSPDGLARRFADDKDKHQSRASSAPETGVRTTDPLPSGLLTDLVRAASCTPPAGRRMLAAQVVYDLAGRPGKMRFGASDLTGACLEAGRAAIILGLAPAASTNVPFEQAVFLVMDPDWIACAPVYVPSAAHGTAPAVRPVVTGLQEPRKVRNVAPYYPNTAKVNGIQGRVVLESVISPAGCMSSVRAVSGPTELLVPALQAVTGWVYTPTLLDGKPVPVMMTVTVNFRLK